MITKKCEICEATIKGISSIKYCSDKCKAKAWRIRNPKNVIEVRKRHYEKNRDKILKNDREKYWNGGKEKSNLQSKNWYNKNKKERAEYTKKYRIEKKKLFDKYKDLERFGGNKQKVLERDGNKCILCKSITKLHIHHIDGTGGSSRRGYKNINNSMENLITVCFNCHRKIHGFEHRNMKRFQSIDDIVRTMPKVIEEYRKLFPPRNRS